MKRTFVIILALTLLFALAGCSNETGTEGPDETAATSAPTSMSTSAPDYSDTDFSGHWGVSEVYDAAGDSVTGSALAALQPDFTLELVEGGAYFIYDSTDAVLGQGTYTVETDVMTLTAGDAQTVYAIADENTLRCTADDGSVTVMTRLPEEDIEEDAEDDGDVCEDDPAQGDDANVSDEAETPEETHGTEATETPEETTPDVTDASVETTPPESD